jgi:hypothetical protein
MCYEKSLAVKALLTSQVKAIEEINEKIRTNNDFLNAANKLYQNYYDKCSQSGNTTGAVVDTTADAYKVGNTTLPSYVNDSERRGSLTNGGMDATWTDSNGKGEASSNSNYSNIDTKEQGNLTMISNAQESIRMYGDELSTKAQVENTKLTQIMQNYNSFLSIATQLAKSTGEYFKSIASNVR